MSWLLLTGMRWSEDRPGLMLIGVAVCGLLTLIAAYPN